MAGRRGGAGVRIGSKTDARDAGWCGRYSVGRGDLCLLGIVECLWGEYLYFTFPGFGVEMGSQV